MMKKTMIWMLTLILTAALFTGCGETSTEPKLSELDALNAVYASIGITEPDALYTVVEESVGETVSYYDVELSVDGVVYRYRVDASRGDFLKVTVNDQEISLEDIPRSEGRNPDAYIGLEAAKAIALADASVTEADIRKFKYEMDYALGRYLYEIEFRTESAKYEYEIDALTGEIFKKDLNDKTVITPSVDTGAYIGTVAAEDAALAHAGIARENAIFDLTKWEMKKGSAVYDVEFVSGGVEYEYTVNALTAAIIRSKSKGETTGEKTKYIGEKRAKAAAFAHAGVSEDAVRSVSVDPDVKNGVTVYEIEFVSGGVEYEYEINALTGEIVKVERERE